MNTDSVPLPTNGLPIPQDEVILVLHRQSPLIVPIEDYLGKDANRAIVLCPNEYVGIYRKSQKVVGFDDYPNNESVEKAGQDILRQYRVKTVIATGEFDIERAGRLRALASLPGQTAQSAEAFRDKLIMKQYASRNGIQCAKYMPLEKAQDLDVAKNTFGYPFVIKPRAGAASVGVEIIRNETQLNDWITQAKELKGYMAEEYISDPMYHVDGFYVRDTIFAFTVSKYLGTCLDYREHLPIASIQINNDSDLHRAMREFTNDVLAAFPTPTATPFHLEVFVDERYPNKILFSEIASRVGGGKIEVATFFRHNIYLSKPWIQFQLDGNLSSLDDCKTNENLFGWVLFPPIPGLVEQIPTACENEHVVMYEATISVGNSIPSEHPSNGQHMAYAVILGAAESDLQEACRAVTKWFYNNLKITGH